MSEMVENEEDEEEEEVEIDREVGDDDDHSIASESSNFSQAVTTPNLNRKLAFKQPQQSSGKSVFKRKAKKTLIIQTWKLI